MIPEIGGSFLNESKMSALTKNSAEKDFKELNSMINLVRDEKGNISSLSISKNDKSMSMLSNQEIWNVNQNKDDSKGFIEQIEILKHGLPLKKKTMDAKINKEDYDDEEINENIRPVKTEHFDSRHQNMMKLNKNELVSNSSTKCTNYTNGITKENKNKANTGKISKKTNFDNTVNLLENQSRKRSTTDQGAVYGGKQPAIPNYGNQPNSLLKGANSSNNNKVPIQRDLNYNNMQNMLPIYQNQMLPPSQFKFPNQKYTQQPQFIQPQFFPQTQYLNTMPNFPIQNDNRRTSKPLLQAQPSLKEDMKKIIVDNIIIGKDKRTTLMLRNIPNKYTLNNVVEEINQSFWGKFDYVNLPIDYERKLNLGYAFVNFVDPFHIILFYETYHNKKWSKYHSDKKMDMTYADKQGKKDINCKDDQTYYAIEDKRFSFSQLAPKLEIPISHLDFFKKIYGNSVCVVEDKNGLYNDKCFVVKHFGKK